MLATTEAFVSGRAGNSRWVPEQIQVTVRLDGVRWADFQWWADDGLPSDYRDDADGREAYGPRSRWVYTVGGRAATLRKVPPGTDLAALLEVVRRAGALPCGLSPGGGAASGPIPARLIPVAEITDCVIDADPFAAALAAHLVACAPALNRDENWAVAVHQMGLPGAADGVLFMNSVENLYDLVVRRASDLGLTKNSLKAVRDALTARGLALLGDPLPVPAKSS